MSQMIETYPIAAGAPVSDRLEVRVAGKRTAVYANGPHSFAMFAFGDGAVEVSIACGSEVKSAVVRPVSLGIIPKIRGNTLSFALSDPCKLSVEVNRHTYLFLFADALEQTRPNSQSETVIWYGPGYHDLNGQDLIVNSGQTLYISGGAYLANVRTLQIRNAENATVCGRGVLSAATRVFNSRNVLIEGIVIAPVVRGWMNIIENSSHVTYRNVKVLTGDDQVVNYDGFDIMSGCQQITIEDAFVRATDDVLTVKHHPSNHSYWSSKAPISHVLFKHSVAWNLCGGSIVRIGPETIGPSIEDVTVQDVDVIHNQAGSVFEIRTVDGTRIERICFEDIRIEEDHRDLINFDMGNWYKVGSRQGHVAGVHFRNIEVRGGMKGCRIQGGDDDHTFANVTFDNVRVDGQLVRDMPGQRIICGRDIPLSMDTGSPALENCTAIVTAAAGRATRVYVVFSEPVSARTAEDIGNYSIDNGAHVLAAHLDPHFRQVVLYTSPLDETVRYSVSVRNIRDMSGNANDREMQSSIAFRPGWTASAGYAAFQGQFGWYYEQFNTVKVKIYSNRNDLIKTPQYWLMNHDPDPGRDCWTGHQGRARVSQTGQCPGQDYASVRTWFSPVDGVFHISGIVTTGEAASDGVYVRILQNGPGTLRRKEVVLWEDVVGEGTSVTHDVQARLQAEDVIRFVVSRRGTVSGEFVQWDPTIRWTGNPGPDGFVTP